MYQYGNVAVQYQKEKKIRPKQRHSNQPPKQQPKPNKQQHVSSQRKILSSGEKLLYIACIIGIVVLLSMLLSRYATITQLNYEIQALEKEVKTIEEVNMNLELIVAEYSSPERIRKVAQEELGMVEKNPNVKVLKPSVSKSSLDSTSNE
ncbi:cell division protein FtsL [Caldalkalibacillus mannanilyticus]|uniref:cell division protein FtsL n=1 Tax=Caldalkalibacillus mannanilyticus TaxID=1418 RepID=UPI00046A8BBE|nr:cell division protein FtsL [Caldalkalibacillus mannanilyticus]